MTDIDDDWDEYDDYEDYPPGWDTPEPDDPWLEEQERHFALFHPDAWSCDCRAPLRERALRLVRGLWWRLRSALRRDRYDEPPF